MPPEQIEVLVTAILGFTMLGLVTWTAAVQITSLAPKIPEYQSNVEAKLGSVNTYAVAALRKVTSTAQGMGEKLSPTELNDHVCGGREVRPRRVPASSPIARHLATVALG